MFFKFVLEGGILRVVFLFRIGWEERFRFGNFYFGFSFLIFIVFFLGVRYLLGLRFWEEMYFRMEFEMFRLVVVGNGFSRDFRVGGRLFVSGFFFVFELLGLSLSRSFR